MGPDKACEGDFGPGRRQVARRADSCDHAQASSAPARRFRRLWAAIVFDAGQIARDTALYLSLVGSLLFALLAFVGRS